MVMGTGAGVSGDVDVRSHVVFGGTKILQLADSRDAATQDKGAAGETYHHWEGRG
jgi:hypothetical protein